MINAIRDALATVLRTHEPLTLMVHDRGSTGYAVSYSEDVFDPGSGVGTETPISRDLDITKEEAAMLLSLGATWTGISEKAPRRDQYQ